MMTIFIEVEINELFMDCSDHIYYTKISNTRGVRRSPGGDQPDMQQEMVFDMGSAVITRQRVEQLPSDLLPYVMSGALIGKEPT